VITTLVGWIVGLVAGYGTLVLFAKVNLLGPIFGSYAKTFAALPLTDEIYMAVRPVYALYGSLTVGLAGLLAVLIPARRVRRLQPTQAMRIE
jgi:ABC-type antimicrobial peptide transport system permease subunit